MKRRILIVDDSELIREKIRSVFDQDADELELATASNGLEGIDLQMESPYDLIITDLIMPKMEGIEFIRRVKKNNAKTKIIAITGSNSLYLEIADKMGADSQLIKPFDENQLLNLSYQLLGQNQA